VPRVERHRRAAAHGDRLLALADHGRVLDAHGATAIRLANGTAAITTARRPREEKPWLKRATAPSGGAAEARSSPRPLPPSPRRPASPEDDPGADEPAQ